MLLFHVIFKEHLFTIYCSGCSVFALIIYVEKIKNYSDDSVLSFCFLFNTIISPNILSYNKDNYFNFFIFKCVAHFSFTNPFSCSTGMRLTFESILLWQWLLFLCSDVVDGVVEFCILCSRISCCILVLPLCVFWSPQAMTFLGFNFRLFDCFHLLMVHLSQHFNFFFVRWVYV